MRTLPSPRWAICGAVVLIAAGCSDDKVAGSTPGGCAAGEVVDGRGNCITTCETTEDCGDPAMECNVATGLCIPVSTQCTRDSDCPLNLECNSFGECVDPTVFTCMDNVDCPPDEECDTMAGTCVPLACDPMDCFPGFVCPTMGPGTDCEPGPGFCAEDNDCNFGERCDDNNTCVSRAGDIVQTCTTNGDCGLASSCQFGVCTCVADLQCAPDGQCVFNVCVVADVGPGINCLTLMCPDGQSCNPQTGVCEPVCVDNMDCGMGQICAPVINRCIDYSPCEDDMDCPGSLTCPFGLGICVGCMDTMDCPPNTNCTVGACLPDVGASNPCAMVNCPMGQACDPFDGSCYNENGTCDNNDMNCRPMQTCNFLNLCSGCSVDGDCRPNQSCVFGTCAPI